MFLQNTGMQPPACSVVTQNTTVLQVMFIYWQKIRLNVLLPTEGCTTLKWPKTVLLQWLASRNSHMISKINQPSYTCDHTTRNTNENVCVCVVRIQTKNKCRSRWYMLTIISYTPRRWIIKYTNERVNKMVSFKSANKQWTTVKFHKKYQMTVFIFWNANTKSYSTTFVSVLIAYSYNHTLMKLLIIQSPYLKIKFHNYNSRCKIVCHAVISRLCYPKRNSNSSNQQQDSYIPFRINQHFKATYKIPLMI